MFGPDDFEVQIQQENPPGIHAEPSIPPAQDEEYGDFIVKHGQNMGGKFLYICYYAVRDAKGSYLGTLEVTQDITEIRTLEGERRLLEYGTNP